MNLEIKIIPINYQSCENIFHNKHKELAQTQI